MCPPLGIYWNLITVKAAVLPVRLAENRTSLPATSIPKQENISAIKWVSATGSTTAGTTIPPKTIFTTTKPLHHKNRLPGKRYNLIPQILIRPGNIWLATGSLTEFKPSKLNILKNRMVVAFPDIGGCEKWQKTAASLDFPIIVSDYLEQHATDAQRKQGLDIADFL